MPHLVVDTASSVQFRMRAPFNHASVIQNQDLIGPNDCVQTMRYDQQGAFSGECG
ncbi:Uncharacterised protein [Mycobacteroides abscessus subsp. abscessus]|nr:Uncharacterised protein [Mycobacteroides abscessus subsp. abscessus]